MFNPTLGESAAISAVKTRQMKQAQLMWPRLSEADLKPLGSPRELVAKLEERYGLSHAWAERQVAVFSRNKQFED